MKPNMRSVLILATVILMGGSLRAQRKITFASQNYIGVLAGTGLAKPELQTINGITKKKWFAGIGLGANWYYQRTMPVFGYCEWGLPIKKTKNIFLSAGAGPNFPWERGRGLLMDADVQYKTGFYWQTGLGYKIDIGKKGDALLLHAGLMNKNFREIITSTYPCVFGPCPNSPDIYKYNLHAMAIRIGYGF